MGNSINKKKKKGQSEKSPPPPPALSPCVSREKPSSLWLLGCPDKVKTAGPKGTEDEKRLTVHFKASQHYQENVFIEGSRPRYLEELHTEAQQGLKILQQEEHKDEGNFADDESVASTDTLCPEQDVGSKDECTSPESRTTPGNTESAGPSAAPARPTLTRQGSTFKPLNQVKRLDRGRRRNRRTTIMGIPNQVQKELALHRSTFQPLVSTQLPNHDSQSSVVLIPTVDGGTSFTKKEGARVHLSELEAFRDDQVIRKQLEKVQSHLTPASSMRPKSLAVPGMTTSFSFSSSAFNFLPEPQGPVMSISPQATYLSTIIPNAVMPASVEVIEIDRSTSRARGGSVNHESVRTVSKSSLTSEDSAVSPLFSRRSGHDGYQSSSSNYDSGMMPLSNSGSNWSESQSSRTIISDSSPFLSNRAALNVQGNQTALSGEGQDNAGPCNSFDGTSSPNGKREIQPPAAQKEAKHKRASPHSLSVMKTKQPPAPPQRTNSLHGNKNRSHSIVLVKNLNGTGSEKTQSSAENILEDRTKVDCINIKSIRSSSISTPLRPSENSSNQLEQEVQPAQEYLSPKTQLVEDNFERTMSPSSGYSSQSGTPTHSPNAISPSSPGKHKPPIKPERVSRPSSSAASPSSSLTSLSSGASELTNPDVSVCTMSQTPLGFLAPATTQESTKSCSPARIRAEVRGLLNIPPPPKVKAPCPPPPETWAHNGHTVELLCGPKIVHKLAETKDSTDEQEESQSEFKKDTRSPEQQKNPNKRVLAICSNEENPGSSSAAHPQRDEALSEAEQRSGADKVPVLKKDNKHVQTEESGISAAIELDGQNVTPKKQPPPIMKKPTKIMLKDKAEQALEKQQKDPGRGLVAEDDVTVDNQKTAHLKTVTVVVEASENEAEGGQTSSLQTVSVEVPSISKSSPPPTPPPAYHPTPPPTRKSPTSSVSAPTNESYREAEEAHDVDSCWPPPPPPLEGDHVFEGGDEVDFPPPPPPSVAEYNTNVMASQASADDKPEVVGTDSKSGCPGDSSSQKMDEIACVEDIDSPSPVELSPKPPDKREENQIFDTTAVPSAIHRNANSPKIDKSLSSGHFSQHSMTTSEPPGSFPQAENSNHGVSFRRAPSGGFRDSRNKELLARHKSAPIPKEDANIPLVTPSLLQMVRLRTVSMSEGQVQEPHAEKTPHEGDPLQGNGPVSTQGSLLVPQKPIRKSLSLKSPPQASPAPAVTLNSPSMRLQDAIRIKASAMSPTDGFAPRMVAMPPAYGCGSDSGAQSLRPLPGCDVLKSPASTASFIFSRSTKKVAVETVSASAAAAQASLKQSVAPELCATSDQSKAGDFANGGIRGDKVPPPVAQKPPHGSKSSPQVAHSFAAKTELSVEGSNASGGVEHKPEVAPPGTTTRVTADTIETLF